jgi:hypothetical protein
MTFEKGLKIIQRFSSAKTLTTVGLFSFAWRMRDSGRMWPLTWFLVLAVQMSSFAFAAVGIERFQIDADQSGTGEPIEAIVVRHSVLFDRLSLADQMELKKTAYDWSQKARDWSFLQFQKAYPEYTEEEFNKLKQADPLEDPRSTRIILIKGDGSGEIIGSLKAVYDDGKTGLPLESPEYFGRLERPEPQIEDFPMLLPPNGKMHSIPSLVGGWVQLMEFVAVQRDLNAILVSLAEMEIFLREPKDFQMAAIEDLSMEALDAIEENIDSLKRDYQKGKFAMRPQTYFLYCDERLVPYYQKLGFKVFIQKGKLYGMSMDRKTFSQITLTAPLFSAARSKLEKRGGVKWVTGPEPHYHKKGKGRFIFWPLKSEQLDIKKEFLSDQGPGTAIIRHSYDSAGLKCSKVYSAEK